MNDDLHPKVLEFKLFINRHPKLIKEIRKSGRSWQEYYEKWILLGEDDPMWQDFMEELEPDKKEHNSELFSRIINLTQNMDIDKFQKQAQQISGAITTLQEILGQFQDQKKPSHPKNQPYNWFRD